MFFSSLEQDNEPLARAEDGPAPDTVARRDQFASGGSSSNNKEFPFSNPIVEFQ